MTNDLVATRRTGQSACSTPQSSRRRCARASLRGVVTRCALSATLCCTSGGGRIELVSAIDVRLGMVLDGHVERALGGTEVHGREPEQGPREDADLEQPRSGESPGRAHQRDELVGRERVVEHRVLALVHACPACPTCRRSRSGRVAGGSRARSGDVRDRRCPSRGSRRRSRPGSGCRRSCGPRCSSHRRRARLGTERSNGSRSRFTVERVSTSPCAAFSSRNRHESSPAHQVGATPVQ